MSTPIPAATQSHVVLPPTAQNMYYAVVSANSGHENVRCATAQDANKEVARLILRDSYTVRK